MQVNMITTIRVKDKDERVNIYYHTNEKISDIVIVSREKMRCPLSGWMAKWRKKECQSYFKKCYFICKIENEKLFQKAYNRTY